MVNCDASIKGLFGGMIVFSCTIISIILYAVFRNKMNETVHLAPSSSLIETNHDHPHTSRTNTAAISHRQHSMSSIIPATMVAAHDPFTSTSNARERIEYSIAILEVVNLCLLALSLCATMWSLIKIRKLNYRRTTTRERQNRKKDIFQYVVLSNRFRRCSHHCGIGRHLFVFDLQCFRYH
jgi:hypothetical protein